MRAAFRRYVALGDSISIDYYPGLDAAGEAVGPVRGLGAAGLLYRNDDRRWPEFRGRDLATLCSGIVFRNRHELTHPGPDPTDNLATDGATTRHVLELQLPRVEPGEERTVVTLTVGGNDMLFRLQDRSPPRDLVRGMLAQLRQILAGIGERLSRSTILVGTVYDPSDGTNDLGSGQMDVQARWLADYNVGVRAAVEETPGAILADIHGAFLGHGLSAPAAERWYWSRLIVEPGLRGASEVRRLWLECLGL